MASKASKERGLRKKEIRKRRLAAKSLKRLEKKKMKLARESLAKNSRRERYYYRKRVVRLEYGFYGTLEWIELRNWAVSVYGPQCMRCGKTHWPCGDHIHSVKNFPELKLNPYNIQILCVDCNKWKGNKTIDFRQRDMGYTFRPHYTMARFYNLKEIKGSRARGALHAERIKVIPDHD